jgi:polyisoprenyl-teichoic acid--peptidoglycan teichoic acid transferase
MSIFSRLKLDRLTIILLVAAVLIAGTLGFFAFRMVREIILPMTTFEIPGAPVASADTPIDALQDGAAPGDIEIPPPAPEALSAPDELPTDDWDGGSRVNILIMGLDFRDWEAGETPRTDTMILFTIDPITYQAGMLSIPRDMWVNIPGYDYGKINTAFYLGELYKVPGGGPALASATVEHFLGVPIQYYAQVDFIIFEQFINEIGGIVLVIEEPITIYPIGKPKVTLQPDRYLVGGDYALAYARTRYTEGGDFDRAKRQQEVIMEIRRQIIENFPTVIANAPQIYQNLAGGIRTNMTFQEALKLASLGPLINVENIKRGIIGPDVVTNAISPDGLNIIVPIPDEIRLIRDEIFTSGGPLGPAAVANDALVLVQQEQARVAIQNGTLTSGMANKTGEYFRSLGMNVVQETNADSVYDATNLIIYNATPYTASYLAALMSINNYNIINRYDPSAQIDIAVILGNDWNNLNPMP